VKAMDDKKIAVWENAKQDFLGVRRALHDTIGGRTQGIYGEIVKDWTRFNPAGRPQMAHISFGPKRFDPPDHEPDGTEINNRLGDCYDKLGDLERLTHRLKPDEQVKLDLREFSNSELRLL
jgi:hypothetical protein